jgi:RNA polymerase sigma-70 factor (ECF subfamily)
MKMGRPMDTPALPPAALVEHAAFVRRLAFHLLRNDAEADDAAQETLARSPPRVGSGVRAWLATVLRNVVRMRARAAVRRASREARSAGEGSVRGTDDGVARAEILRAVATAVAALDPRHREVVFMRHYEDLPPRAIATRLGVPLVTVKSRLARAHERLRRCLDEGRRGNVEDWRSAIAGLAGWDFAPSASVLGEGAVVMGTAKVGAAVVALGLLLGGAYLLSREGDAPDRDTQPRAGAGLATAPVDESAAPMLTGTGRPPEVAPPPATAKSGEPEDLDAYWQSLRTPVAAGRVEGVVLGGKRPVRGGRARLWQEPMAQSSRPTSIPGSPWATRTSARTARS